MAKLLVSRPGMLYCATGHETSLNKNRNSDIQSRLDMGVGRGSDNDAASGLVKASRHGLPKGFTRRHIIKAFRRRSVFLGCDAVSLGSRFPTFRGSVPASSLRVEISRYAALHVPVERLAKLRHCANISKLTKTVTFPRPLMSS